jgi:hypothetical protein
MPNPQLTHTVTASVTYKEKRALLGMAREQQLTVSALIRKLLIQAVSPGSKT